MMLAECSGVGAIIELRSLPKPDSVSLERWLQTFPSYGYLLAVPPANVPAVLACFGDRNIAAADIGTITADHRVAIADGRSSETIWDFTRDPLIGCAPSEVFA
jgi:selenophosphate synthetase-related protein